VQHAHPLIDISEEVGNWRDHGLLGFALDPDFLNNGYFYCLYVVDYHHAAYFGTPQYSATTDEYFRDTIIRLTRFQADVAGDFHDVVPGSRTVLISPTLQGGIPNCHQSHGAGSLAFGRDGTLLITIGDGASYETTDIGGPTSGSSNTALADGIITPAEDVGAFRAQLVNSHAGKVLRVDPATGLGVPSNPFYDPANPGAPRSRLWALGLRNPFRASLRPGTGSTNPADAMPGSLYIGDVGWTVAEEMNVARAAGQNFGWPIYEGHGSLWSYRNTPVANLTTPNPLANGGSCPNFFTFQDLLADDTLLPPSFPNPCNVGVQIPSSLPRFKWTRARLDWIHPNGPCRVPTYNQFGYPSIAWVGDPGSPVPGPQFGGNSSTGGVWYTGGDFPAPYTNVYYAADFVNGWMRAFVFDANDNLTEVREFAPEGEAGAVVCIATNPTAGGLYYINYDEAGISRLHRIQYVGNENIAAVAMGSATPRYGPAPLAVQFSSAGSFDPEGSVVTYRWNFGDGTPESALPNPLHVYRDEEDITAAGTFIARVFELNPPQPLGSGNRNPEVMRDGDYPPVGNQDSARQYDTYHAGDQGSLDYVGYTFPVARRITQITFQEGKHFGDGGWFTSIHAQHRVGAGPWVDVTGFSVNPPYPGGNDGESFETYTIRFNPVDATAIRLVGTPGGSAKFITIGELRVLAERTPAGQPRRFDATLTVCDNVQLCSSVTVPVWMNNSPPAVQINTPVDGSFYNPSATFFQPLEGAFSDAEHASNTLACSWRTILHHDEHTHPEPADPNCATQALINPHGDVGDTFYWEFQFTVTDPLGLATTVSSSMFTPPPRCPGDANFDNVVSFLDVTTVLANFGGIGPYGDADDSGEVEFTDLTIVLSRFGDSCAR
jgi:glucose/arabinose dehydrogenase